MALQASGLCPISSGRCRSWVSPIFVVQCALLDSMLHSMTVVKEAGLATFGQRWATEAGYASLIFDYRGFGDSDGEPRNLVSLHKQLEDYRSVVQWARQRPELFLNNKIVVMGSALSGLAVANLVLEDSGLAGGMAHSPMLDGKLSAFYRRAANNFALSQGYATLNSLEFNPRLIFWALVDTIKSKLGLSPVFVRAVAPPGEFALLNTPSSHQGWFFISSSSLLVIP